MMFMELGQFSGYTLNINPLLQEIGFTGDLSRNIWKEKGQLVLANSHPIFNDPQPLLENVIHVGGLHIRPTKPLPSDLKKFMDDSKEGNKYIHLININK